VQRAAGVVGPPVLPLGFEAAADGLVALGHGYAENSSTEGDCGEGTPAAGKTELQHVAILVVGLGPLHWGNYAAAGLHLEVGAASATAAAE
jgi:hypothetical protein